MKLGLFNLAAGAACILVGIQAAELWSAPVDVIALSGNAAAVQEPPRTEQVRFEAPELALFAEIAERPLFSPNRQPPEPKMAVSENAEKLVIRAAVPAERPLQIILLGVASTSDVQSAIVQVEDGGSELLRLGESLEGWTLASIEQETVVFARDEERVTALLGEVAEVKVPDTGDSSRSERRNAAEHGAARFLPASATGSGARGNVLGSMNFQDTLDED